MMGLAKHRASEPIQNTKTTPKAFETESHTLKAINLSKPKKEFNSN